MALIELNLSAKERSIKYHKLVRRREMAKYRKYEIIYFDGVDAFPNFLEMYNWKKRPVETEQQGKLLKVKFLDYKPPKKKYSFD